MPSSRNLSLRKIKFSFKNRKFCLRSVIGLWNVVLWNKSADFFLFLKLRKSCFILGLFSLSRQQMGWNFEFFAQVASQCYLLAKWMNTFKNTTWHLNYKVARASEEHVSLLSWDQFLRNYLLKKWKRAMSCNRAFS
jgi:hypothetical protein